MDPSVLYTREDHSCFPATKFRVPKTRHTRAPRPRPSEQRTHMAALVPSNGVHAGEAGDIPCMVVGASGAKEAVRAMPCERTPHIKGGRRPLLEPLLHLDSKAPSPQYRSVHGSDTPINRFSDPKQSMPSSPFGHLHGYRSPL